MQVRHFHINNPLLAPFIDYYYLLTTEGDTAASVYQAFPSNNTPVCFFMDCKIRLQAQKAVVERQRVKSFTEVTVGTATKPVQVSIGHGIKEFSIVFKPLGLNCMQPAKLGAILQHEFSSTHLFPDLHENIMDIMNGNKTVDSLEEKLLGRLHLSGELNLLQRIIATLYKNEERITIEHIARESGLSYKSIYRLFKAHLGASPAQFRNIIKFRHAVAKSIDPVYKKKISKVALDSGYYDQANLTNEFKKLTKHTPKKFPQAVTLVAGKKIAWKFE